MRSKNLIVTLSLATLTALTGCGDQSFEAAQNQSSKKSSPPFFEGQRTIKLTPYELPPVIDKRNEADAEADPNIRKQEAYRLSQASKKLQLDGFDFDVDLDRKKMTFRGRLMSDSKLIENIELEGNFNPSESPWNSNDLFPTDEKVRSEKRMQATAVCIDTNICDRVAVRFYIEFEGELLELHFEKDAVLVEEANSGHRGEDDMEEVEEYLNSLPKPRSNDKTPSQPDSETEDDLFPDVDVPATPKKEDKKASTPQPAPEEEEDGSEDEGADDSASNGASAEKEEIFDNDDVALEYNGPIATPTPKVTKDSVKGIDEKIKAAPAVTTKTAQAIGSHNRGHLQYVANPLPTKGPGFVRRDGPAKTYAADPLIQTIKISSQRMESAIPGRPPISIGNLSQKSGGCIGGRYKTVRGKKRCASHASHQNGLDGDLAFPRLRGTGKNFWNPLKEGWGDFDKQRFWKFSKELACSSNGVMAVFIDRNIKAQMCQYARSVGENPNDKSSCAYKALRQMYHQRGHANHIHVRKYCPGTVGCSNAMVSLPNSSGCK